MAQEIYNEGRVVGFSAWELYKYQALSNGVPENEIPNEREWLASMLGSGASMVLRITGTNGGFDAGIHDYELPIGSNLTAAGVIVASPFMGDCEFSTIGSASWAKKIKSYGSLIENDATAFPTSINVPSSDYDDYKNCVSDFLKISDGIVYTKNAEWIYRSEHYSETFQGTGETVTFELTCTSTITEITSITKNGLVVEPTDYSYDLSAKTVTFNTAPTSVDVIVIYYDAINKEPNKDINPNFNSSSTVVRLYFSSALTHEVSILLTGFSNKRVLQGLSGYARSVNDYAVGGSTDIDHNDWVNGGLLGPEIIPWASKIIFTVPNSSLSVSSMLERVFPKSNSLPQSNESIDGITFYGSRYDEKVKTSTVVDFDTINLLDYYSKHSQLNTLPEYIRDMGSGLNDSLNHLVAWYPGMTAAKLQAELDANPRSNANFFPPALYAAKITEADINKPDPTVQLVPLDTAAPGTIKAFKSSTEAINYKTMMPENYAMYYNQYTLAYSFALPNVDVRDWPGSAQLHYGDAPEISLVAGNQTTKLISLCDSTGVSYPTTGTGGTIPIGPANNITWGNLLQALPNNYDLDVLGNKLHLLGNELTATNTIGVAANNQISGIAATKVTVTGNYPIGITTTQTNGTNLATLDQGQAYKSGTEFIEFSNGLRLYISNSEPDPTNVPLGSIGIGWISDSEVVSGVLPSEHVSSPAMGG